MASMPSVPGRKVVRALERLGFTVDRVRGSHHVMIHADGRVTTVSVHGGRDMPKGTLRGILRDVGLEISDLDLS